MVEQDIAQWLANYGVTVPGHRLKEFAQAAEQIARRFPDGDSPRDVDDRNVAMMAATAWFRGETTTVAAGTELRETRDRYSQALVRAQQVAVLAVCGGADVDEVADQTAVESGSLRTLAGLPRDKPAWIMTEPVQRIES